MSKLAEGGSNMKYEDFDKLLEEMVIEEKTIGKSKGKEYTQGSRLDNFERMGAEIKCPHCNKPIGPMAVLWVFLKKHLDSVLSYINKGYVSTEPIQGRIKDCRVYMSLLRGLIEKKENPEKYKEDGGDKA